METTPGLERVEVVDERATGDPGAEPPAEAALIDAEGRANDDFQQCRTLYNQLSLSVTMRALLPHGLLGLFALLLFLAMLSTDDTRIYSAALTIAVKQLDYYQMFNTLACAMWSCGSGAIMMFGLYSRFGTTAGAWTALGTSAALSGAYLYVQRSWADVVYPAIAKASLVDSFDRALRWLSSPFEPYLHWEMDAVRCPVNAIEFNFFLSLLCILLYVVVSKLTCKVPFNLERMLHRGRYAIFNDGAAGAANDDALRANDDGASRQLTNDDNSVVSATGGTSLRTQSVRHCAAPRLSFPRFASRIAGITPEYTRGDKAIAWGVFAYSFGYGFGLCFLGVVAWNAIHPWPVEWWSRYFVGIYFVVPCIVACVTTVWFGVGPRRSSARRSTPSSGCAGATGTRT